MLFKENQRPPFLLIAILISFDNYKSSIIISLKGKNVVPIASIRHT